MRIENGSHRQWLEPLSGQAKNVPREEGNIKPPESSRQPQESDDREDLIDEL